MALEAIPRVLSVLGSYPIRPRRPSPARLCGHPPFWIGRFLRARSFLSEALPSPLVLTPGGVEHPWLGSSTGTSNRLRMSWRLCRHWLRSATRDPLFDRSSSIGPGKNLGYNPISSHRPDRGPPERPRCPPDRGEERLRDAARRDSSDEARDRGPFSSENAGRCVEFEQTGRLGRCGVEHPDEVGGVECTTCVLSTTVPPRSVGVASELKARPAGKEEVHEGV